MPIANYIIVSCKIVSCPVILCPDYVLYCGSCNIVSCVSCVSWFGIVVSCNCILLSCNVKCTHSNTDHPLVEVTTVNSSLEQSLTSDMSRMPTSGCSGELCDYVRTYGQKGEYS